jgi:hypothetical protein
MPRSPVERIREKIRLRQYDMTAHAMGEMAEDDLDITDFEHAILSGRVARIEKDDPRGNKYVIEGVATDSLTPIGVVSRFTSGDRYLIITVYQLQTSSLFHPNRSTFWTVLQYGVSPA